MDVVFYGAAVAIQLLIAAFLTWLINGPDMFDGEVDPEGMVAIFWMFVILIIALRNLCRRLVAVLVRLARPMVIK